MTGKALRNGSAKPAPTQVAPPSADLSALPLAVQRLRARILKAAAGSDIDDLEIPLGWNELQPLFMRGQKGDFDPVAYLKTRSFDGQGREMLGVLRAVFTAPYAREVRGPTVSYLWPAFPVPLERAPTIGQRLHVWRCVRFADLAATAPDGGPLIHRAAIGEDGTWQFFWTEQPAG